MARSFGIIESMKNRPIPYLPYLKQPPELLVPDETPQYRVPQQQSGAPSSPSGATSPTKPRRLRVQKGQKV